MKAIDKFVASLSRAAHRLSENTRDAAYRSALDRGIRLLQGLKTGKQRTRYAHAFTKKGAHRREPRRYKNVSRQRRDGQQGM